MYTIPTDSLDYNTFFTKKIAAAERQAQRCAAVSLRSLSDALTHRDEAVRLRRQLDPQQQRHMIAQQYQHEKMYQRIINLEGN